MRTTLAVNVSIQQVLFNIISLTRFQAPLQACVQSMPHKHKEPFMVQQTDALSYIRGGSGSLGWRAMEKALFIPHSIVTTRVIISQEV